MTVCILCTSNLRSCIVSYLLPFNGVVYIATSNAWTRCLSMPPMYLSIHSLSINQTTSPHLQSPSIYYYPIGLNPNLNLNSSPFAIPVV
ncbi:hypothetical protein ASPWEDRAFT_133490 [Aspergillus wentii DTO 134E9]|uniref:Uncharacterized protein n=1 Tax=Aspergillus wentii DTO 134E9 TaxID=1073089 RepID=A0A1L9RKK2_ASPWE|nr:uncharacterized protein ASPWEDRAFT_133490 [Aspergillus wentii DTO 134E9]OJJ35445.1 hypothetical protein ASPWEDRAFT_133490 [Aspergillus wentii DTO 134E9]